MMVAAALNIMRGVENPIYFEHGISDVRPEQMRAIILMIMEVSLLVFACSFTCTVFIMIRIVFFRKKIDYPKAFTQDQTGDFLIENLPEIEMFYTVLSPAILGFCILWSFSEAESSVFFMLNEISILVSV